MTDATPTEDLVLYLADTTLAAGLQYGLWVERSPSTEEQVALSSMSQDKLGHARAFLSTAEKVTGRTQVELQYDRAPDAFRWNPAWAVELPTWDHLVVAQTLFSRGLMADLQALAEGTTLSEPLAKIQQEEAWHTRHGDAWLASAAADRPADVQGALDGLWPFLVGFFGPEGEERFPAALDAGIRTDGDDELRQTLLDDVVPILEDAGLAVPTETGDDGWTLDPPPTAELVEELEQRAGDHTVELASLLQDPEGRELAELT